MQTIPLYQKTVILTWSCNWHTQGLEFLHGDVFGCSMLTWKTVTFPINSDLNFTELGYKVLDI